MAEGRRLVGTPLPEKPGRFLRRGVGMGGPASLFTWALCFDPVSWIAMVAAGCKNLLYVDDLLGKVKGPGQTLLLYLALLASTHAAGLRVEDHDCVVVHLKAPQRAVMLALKCFPTVVHAARNGADCALPHIIRKHFSMIHF